MSHLDDTASTGPGAALARETSQTVSPVDGDPHLGLTPAAALSAGVSPLRDPATEPRTTQHHLLVLIRHLR